jgi:hypothetical protein
VFDALSGLAQSPSHRLVIMGGNHDPELIFPAVREAVERRLGVGFMNPGVCWLVHGEALRLRVGDAVVLAEHGNSLDPWNRIDHAALQSALSLASRNLSDVSDYQPPPGSRLVLEVVNVLRKDYGWVDCLKPETEAVLPLLWHFSTPAQRCLIFNLADEYLSMKVFAHNLDKRRNPERLYKGEKEAEDSQKDRAFREWVDAVHEEERLTGATRVRRSGRTFSTSCAATTWNASAAPLSPASGARRGGARPPPTSSNGSSRGRRPSPGTASRAAPPAGTGTDKP